VLKFGNNSVDCERDDKVVVFVKVRDVFDENDGGFFVKLDIGEVELDVRVEIGMFDEGRDGDEDDKVSKFGAGRGISKISTTSEYPLEFSLPPKNILFIDDEASHVRA
jgi:hypothetical protein